jgi:hypothetical protein
MISISMTTTVKWARQAMAAVMAASVLVGGPALAGGSSSSSRVPDFVKPVRVSGTIVDVAVSNPAFSTLVTALTAAGLVRSEERRVGKECNSECSCRELVRPGPTACGVDLFATSANAGWPLAVVRQEEIGRAHV